MVQLVVKNLAQITLLESKLMSSGIDYVFKIDDGKYGLSTPYLLVDNVPLDEQRAFKWIKERVNE